MTQVLKTSLKTQQKKDFKVRPHKKKKKKKKKKKIRKSRTVEIRSRTWELEPNFLYVCLPKVFLPSSEKAYTLKFFPLQ